MESRITIIEGWSSCDVVRKKGEGKERKRIKEKIEEIGRASDLIGEFSTFSSFRLSSFPSRSYLHYPSLSCAAKVDQLSRQMELPNILVVSQDICGPRQDTASRDFGQA